MNVIGSDLISVVRELSFVYDTDTAETVVLFMNYEAKLQYRNARKSRDGNYYNNKEAVNKTSLHALNVFSRYIKSNYYRGVRQEIKKTLNK
jgi:ribosomal protein RSM22 (predicted rRNA methylase)